MSNLQGKLLFDGVSQNFDFIEALRYAIDNAKTNLQSDLVSWSLEKLSGFDGGFVLKTELTVTIRVKT